VDPAHARFAASDRPVARFAGYFCLERRARRNSLGLGNEFRWAVAKLVRHQALDLAFEGSNPSRPAIAQGEALKPTQPIDANEEGMTVVPGSSGVSCSRANGGISHV
jgi:hypothetical protein